MCRAVTSRSRPRRRNTSAAAGCATTPRPAPLTGADIVERVKAGRSAQEIIDELRATDTVIPLQASDILALHEALEALARQDDRKSRIIEMRYFAGMTSQEIADATDTSVATVGREIRLAHAWLLRHMQQ